MNFEFLGASEGGHELKSHKGYFIARVTIFKPFLIMLTKNATQVALHFTQNIFAVAYS